MKKLLAAMVLATAVIGGNAFAGVYDVVPYGNNPFLFCTKGMPHHGWVPGAKGTGEWRAIVKRRHVNRMWIPTYQKVCSAAGDKGANEPLKPNANEVQADPAKAM